MVVNIKPEATIKYQLMTVYGVYARFLALVKASYSFYVSIAIEL